MDHGNSNLFARVRLAAGLFAALALTGCETSQIVARDSHVALPSVRIAASLDEDRSAPAEPRSGRAIEFSLTRAKGSGEQRLEAGRAPVILNNVSFPAPDQLRHDFDISYADLSFRWRKFFNDSMIGLELSGGIGYTSTGLSVHSGTQDASDRFQSYGGQGGVGLIVRMRPSTSLHARVSGFASGDGAGIGDMERYELFLAQGLGDNLSLRAGYADWEVNGDSGVSSSRFQLKFAGPTLQLGMDF